jgi:hypothetical protein
MTRPKIIGLLIGLAVVVAAIIIVRWPKDDRSLTQAMVGTWQAVEPTNAALHKRVEGVDVERVIFSSDGSLTYILESKSDPKSSKVEPWGWKIEKGELMIRYLGEDSTKEWYHPIRFKLSETTLSINRKGFPTKVFIRVNR